MQEQTLYLTEWRLSADLGGPGDLLPGVPFSMVNLYSHVVSPHIWPPVLNLVTGPQEMP